MHEVLAGDTYHPQLESVPEQSWSTASFLTAAVRGLFGIEVNGETKGLTLAPHLRADWDHASVHNVRVGGSTLDFDFRQRIDGLKVQIRNSGDVVHLAFDPEIPIGSNSVAATAGGHRLPATVSSDGQDEHARLMFVVPHGNSEIALSYSDGVAIVMPPVLPSLGEPSTGMKLTAISLKRNVLRLELDLVPSQRNSVRLVTKRRIEATTGSKVTSLNDDSYELVVEPGPGDNQKYQHREVTVTFGR